MIPALERRQCHRRSIARVAHGLCLELCFDTGADKVGAVDQVFVLDHVQDGEGRGAEAKSAILEWAVKSGAAAT